MKMSLSAGRPTVGEVDLGALEFNYRQIQKRIPEGVKLLCVVKADAYGHGAIPVSRKLEKLGVEYLGVAIPEEGVELRKGGVKAPILVLGGIFEGGVDQIFRFHLTPVLFRKDSLKLLSREAEKRRKKVKVHVKVDTGMGRLGVPFNLWPDFLKEVKRFPNIEIEGILSHFSMTDEEKALYSQPMESISKSRGDVPRRWEFPASIFIWPAVRSSRFSRLLREFSSARDHALWFLSFSDLSRPHPAQTRHDAEDPHPFSEIGSTRNKDQLWRDIYDKAREPHRHPPDRICGWI